MRAFFSLLIIMLCTLACYADELFVDFVFSPAEFTLNEHNGQLSITSSRTYYAGMPGAPAWVEMPVNVLLPPNTRAKNARIVHIERELFATETELAPFMPPAILPLPGFEPKITPALHDAQAYALDELMPREDLIYAGIGNLSGYSIGALILRPISINPYRKEIWLTTKLTVALEYEKAQIERPRVRSPQSALTIEKLVKTSVYNPQSVDLYRNICPLDAGEPDYLVIAPSAVFAPRDTITRFLLSLRRQGWHDTLVTVPEILLTYSGVDNAEKIRNCVKDFWLTHGIANVVFLGDGTILTCRHAYAMTSDAGFYDDEDEIPCDLYFADLDGNWNLNANSIYGEVADSVDLYMDVLIGRVAFSNADGFGGFLRKYITYVENPPIAFGSEMLNSAMVLWTDPFTDGGVAKDMLAAECLPPYFSLSRAYQTLGTGGVSNFILEMNTGYNAINHSGHASYQSIGVGEHSYIYRDGASALTNFPRCGVMYSIGCWPAAFDYDCIAKRLVANSNGGVVAFVGNSRYGWGSPGNPGYGYSEYFDRAFWQTIFHTQPNVGFALAAIKTHFAPFARWQNVWRWKEYELSLLGEPSMIFWNGTPLTTSLSLPTIMPASGANIDIAYEGEFCATAIQDGEIIGRICGEHYASLWVMPVTSSAVEISVHGISGEKTLIIDTIIVSGGTVHNISMDNYEPQTFTSGTLFLEINAQIRNNAAIDATIDMSPRLTHGGTITSWSCRTRTLAPAETATVALQVALSSADERIVTGSLDVTCAGHRFPLNFAVTAVSPRLSVRELRLFSPGCLAHNFAEWSVAYSGARVQIENTGTLTYNGTTHFECAPLGLSIDRTVSLPIGTTDISLGSLVFPAGTLPDMLPLICTFSEQCDTFWISVGAGTFYASAEIDEGFTFTGDWHTTADDAFTGDHAFRCARATGMYAPFANAMLSTPEIIIGEQAFLEFVMRYTVTTYGSDGVHVLAIRLDEPDTVHLDYIGSGGALGLLNFETGWTNWLYSIPFPPRARIKIAFCFTSDGADEAQGFFIDDIRVHWQPTLADTGTEIAQHNENLPIKQSISVVPNPFNAHCQIIFAHDAAADVEIFSLMGIRVESFSKPVAMHTLDINAQNLATGVYFARITQEGRQFTQRLYLCK